MTRGSTTLQYSKKKPEGDLTEITTLRAKLDRAEAAIEVGKLDHSMAVADLQGKLLEREETLHRLEEEVGNTQNRFKIEVSAALHCAHMHSLFYFIVQGSYCNDYTSNDKN